MTLELAELLRRAEDDGYGQLVKIVYAAEGFRQAVEYWGTVKHLADKRAKAAKEVAAWGAQLAALVDGKGRSDPEQHGLL